MEGELHLEEKRGVTMPYKGYVEANLTVPDLPHYNEGSCKSQVWG